MGTLGTPPAVSESEREQLRSAADDSTKPESFLSLWVRCGDLLLCVAKAFPRRGLLTCSTSGRDRDKSGFQLSLLPELSEELSESRSGVDLDLLLKELTSSSLRSWAAWSCTLPPPLTLPWGWGAGGEALRLGVETLRPQFMMVCSLW